jgi:hypothetical protein
MEQAPSMRPFTRVQLNDALIRINILRAREPPDPMALDLLEGAMEALFLPSPDISSFMGVWRRGA